MGAQRNSPLQLLTAHHKMDARSLCWLEDYHLHEEIMLNRVWAIDYLSLPRGGTPAEEETVK